VLQITALAGFEQFLHELGRLAERLGLPEPTHPDVLRLLEVGQKYGYESVGPPLTPTR